MKNIKKHLALVWWSAF